MPNSHEMVPAASPCGFATAPRDVTRGPRRAGFLVIALFGLVFGAWAALAPLAGGAVASGRIAPDSSVRSVQHLEGGLVREIFVKEGDMVPFGAPLVAIDDIASLADMEVLLDRRRARLAESARLASELTARETVDFPPELRRDGAEIVAAEQRIFEARV
jgi:multidrug efflux pump subunit AcrA (membrane-fusion protein)